MLMAQPATYNKFESCHMLMAEPSTYDNFLFILLETYRKTYQFFFKNGNMSYVDGSAINICQYAMFAVTELYGRIVQSVWLYGLLVPLM